MIIKFNPSGTHVKGDYLKVRLDIYPEPTDKTYAIHHVFVPDETSPQFIAGYPGAKDIEGNPKDPIAYKTWLDGLPHVWKLNPMLCHFVTVPSTITKSQLQTLVTAYFNKASLKTLDDALSISDITQVRSIMNLKLGTAPKAGTVNINTINTRLANLEVRV